MSATPSAAERLVRGALSPVVTLFEKLGVGPLPLTIAGLLLNLGAAVVVGWGHLGWGAAAFLGASLFDVLDGSLARRLGVASRLGAFLDSTFDRLSESALFVALLVDHARHPYGPDWLPAVMMVGLAGALTTSYVRARAEGVGSGAKVGLLERPQRVVLLTVGLAAGRPVLGFALHAVAILGWWTVLQRIVHVWGALQREDRS